MYKTYIDIVVVIVYIYNGWDNYFLNISIIDLLCLLGLELGLTI